jgi:putative ATP-dependent endonuclease of the OLD family
MRLARVRIHQFRSVIDGAFDLQAYGMLIGRNNCGKTGLIDALRAFYEKDGFKFQVARDFPHKGKVDDESWIDLAFVLTREEYASLPEGYRWREGCLRVRKYFATQDKARKAGEIYGFQTAKDVSTTPFHGAKGVGKGKLGEVIYIPAVSAVEDHTKTTGPSALRDLLQMTLSGIAESSSSLRKLEDVFSEVADSLKIEPGTNGVSFASIEEGLTKALSRWMARFQLSVKAPSPDLLLKNLIEHSIVDTETGRDLKAEQMGSGFQRHLIYSLISLKSQFGVPSEKRVKKEFAPEMTLVLFEEPEAFLHPSQQRILHHELRNLTARDENSQVLCSSHSPQFVSTQVDELRSLVRLEKKNGITKIYQLKIADLDAISGETAAVASIVNKDQAEKSEEASAEAIWFFLQLDPRRAAMFYCDHVVLVEGPADRVVIEHLRDTGHLRIGDKTVEIVDTLGKYHVHRLMMLCRALGVEHSVILDKDSAKQGRPAQIHRELNDYLTNLGKEFGTQVSFISPHLEGLLKLPANGVEGWRKPLVALSAIRNGRTSESDLKSLAAIVSGAVLPQPVSREKTP